MLEPIILTDEQLAEWEETEQQDIDMPSKTYKINFETGEIIAEFIDEEEAVLQAIHKLIKTHRFFYDIYSDDYGSELDTVIGEQHTAEYLTMEIQRIIEDAVEVDDRILGVDDFVVEVIGDTATVSFSVSTNVTSEILYMEVDIYV